MAKPQPSPCPGKKFLHAFFRAWVHAAGELMPELTPIGVCAPVFNHLTKPPSMNLRSLLKFSVALCLAGVLSGAVHAQTADLAPPTAPTVVSAMPPEISAFLAERQHQAEILSRAQNLPLEPALSNYFAAAAAGQFAEA
jgi:hypothetical protein